MKKNYEKPIVVDEDIEIEDIANNSTWNDGNIKDPLETEEP